MSLATTVDTYIKPMRLSNSAIGDIAFRLVALEEAFSPDEASPWTLNGHVERAIFELKETYVASASNNWDSYGAVAVSPLTFSEARRFISALPSTLPMPEVAATPDGDISLDWYSGPDKNLTILLEGTNTIMYSARFGPNDREYGRKSFNDAIPKAIVKLVDRVFS